MIIFCSYRHWASSLSSQPRSGHGSLSHSTGAHTLPMQIRSLSPSTPSTPSPSAHLPLTDRTPSRSGAFLCPVPIDLSSHSAELLLGSTFAPCPSLHCVDTCSAPKWSNHGMLPLLSSRCRTLNQIIVCNTAYDVRRYQGAPATQRITSALVICFPTRSRYSARPFRKQQRYVPLRPCHHGPAITWTSHLRPNRTSSHYVHPTTTINVSGIEISKGL